MSYIGIGYSILQVAVLIGCGLSAIFEKKLTQEELERASMRSMSWPKPVRLKFLNLSFFLRFAMYKRLQ